MKKTYEIIIKYKQSSKHLEQNEKFLVSGDSMKDAIDSLCLVLENHNTYQRYRHFEIISSVVYTKHKIIN